MRQVSRQVLLKRLPLLILVLSLLLAACASPETVATLPSTREPATQSVDTPSSPTGAPTGTPKAAQPEKTVPQGSPTSAPTGCSSAGLELLAPMVVDDRRQGKQLTLVDVTNGLPSCEYDPVPLDRNNQLFLSHDGKRMAVITSKQDDFFHSRLLFVDLAAGRVFPSSIVVDNWFAGVDFSPDGGRLALAYSQFRNGPQKPEDTRYTILITSFGSQEEPVETTLPFAPHLLRFTQDGSAIVAYGIPDGLFEDGLPAASVALLDAADLSVLWKQDLQEVKHGYVKSEKMTGIEYLMDFLEPAVVYSAQKNVLYIVHADQEKLTRVDFDGRKVTTMDIHPRLSWIERWLTWFAHPALAKALSGDRKQAVLDPDGGRMYVIAAHEDVETDQNGNLSPVYEPLGMQVLDPDTGEELSRIETTAGQIDISPDGKTVFLTTWQRGDQKGRVEAFSTKDWTSHASFDGDSFWITMSAIGKPHLFLLKDLHGDTRLTLLDWDTLGPVGSWEVEGYPFLAGMP